MPGDDTDPADDADADEEDRDDDTDGVRCRSTTVGMTADDNDTTATPGDDGDDRGGQ